MWVRLGGWGEGERGSGVFVEWEGGGAVGGVMEGMMDGRWEVEGWRGGGGVVLLS
jgi:hypothetical protein